MAQGLHRVVVPCWIETTGAQANVAKSVKREEIEAFVVRMHQGLNAVDNAPVLPGNSPPDLIVIKFPGTAGRAERSTPFPANLVDVPTSEVWTWNPPGYGGSTGRACITEMVPFAIEFTCRVLEQRQGPKTRVWLCGNSLGCAVGLGVAAALRSPSFKHSASQATIQPTWNSAAKFSVDALLLRNPPPLVELVSERDAWWNLKRGGRYIAAAIPQWMNTVVNAARVDAPIAFLESENDTLVTPKMQRLVRDAHRGPQRTMVLRGAAHNSAISDDQREEAHALIQWLWEQRSASAVRAGTS